MILVPSAPKDSKQCHKSLQMTLQKSLANLCQVISRHVILLKEPESTAVTLETRRVFSQKAHQLIIMVLQVHRVEVDVFMVVCRKKKKKKRNNIQDVPGKVRKCQLRF